MDKFNISLSKIPKYGDHMTSEEFIQTVNSGEFVDYDGHGYYATDNGMTELKVKPSHIKNKHFNYAWSHIVWFNK